MSLTRTSQPQPQQIQPNSRIIDTEVHDTETYEDRLVDRRTSIPAFKCPRCAVVIEIGTKEYFTLKGTILLGEDSEVIKGGSMIIRLCKSCLRNIIEHSDGGPVYLGDSSENDMDIGVPF